MNSRGGIKEGGRLLIMNVHVPNTKYTTIIIFIVL